MSAPEKASSWLEVLFLLVMWLLLALLVMVSLGSLSDELSWVPALSFRKSLSVVVLAYAIAASAALGARGIK